MTGTKAGSREADTKKILLGKGWLFHLGDCPDAWKKDYAPEGWQEVTLPHDWSVSLPFSREYSSGTGYAAGGIGWYRCSFRLPESPQRKKNPPDLRRRIQKQPRLDATVSISDFIPTATRRFPMT